jgi:chromate transporter
VEKKVKVGLGELFMVFLKIGAVSFGGGYAMLPVITYELCQKRHWIAEEEMQNVFAVTGCLPGAIALNAAAFTGYITRGIRGMVAGAVGNLLPSVVIVSVLCLAASAVKGNWAVEAAFCGIRPAVIVLIAYAAVRMGKESLRDIWSWGLCLLAVLVCIFMPQVNIFFVILFGGAAGIILGKLGCLRHKEEP